VVTAQSKELSCCVDLSFALSNISFQFQHSAPLASSYSYLLFGEGLGGSGGGTLDQNWAPTPPNPSHSYYEQRQQNILEQQPGQQPGFIKQIGAGGDFKRTVGEGRRSSKQAAAAAGERKQAPAEPKATTTTPMTGVFNGNTPFQLSSSHDKRFRSLPPTEMLPRNETLGGYIFVCNNDTMQEDLKRQLFGLPQRYRDSVRAIQPGLPLFLYNYTTHQLHGIFEAS
jgi:hypothetical protein